MGKFFMDLNNGDIGFAFDENSGVTSTGQPVMRVGDNMITNLMTGEVHFINSWDNDSDEDLDEEDF